MKKVIYVLMIVLFSSVVYGAEDNYVPIELDPPEPPNMVGRGNCGGLVQCNCGDILTENHTMWYDLNDCPNHGLIIGNNNIKLDCDGHLVDGTSNPNYYGIFNDNLNGITIQNCEVKEFGWGIMLYINSNDNSIINNSLSNNGRAVVAYSSDNNLIAENFVNKSWYSGIRLYATATENRVMNNHIRESPVNGAIMLEGVSMNSIAGNSISDGIYGIWLYLHSDQNNLTNNYVHECDEGIKISGSSNYNQISENNIVNNTQGIRVGSNSYDNSFSNNKVLDSSDSGIYLEYSFNSEFAGNTIANNQQYGVYSSGTSPGNIFYDNYFYSNGDNAEDLRTDNNWNNSVTGNYWDDFENNSGYPNNYEVTAGYAYDYKPILGPINCGDTIYKDTVLQEDLIDCIYDGLIIGADDITLDCNGHSINGIGGGNDRGIKLTDKSNIVIKNCNVSKFNYGIQVHSLASPWSNNISIINNIVSFNAYSGIQIDLRNSLIMGNIVNDNGGYLGGIVLTGGENNTVRNNMISSNQGSTGLIVWGSEYNKVFDNTITNNLHTGIDIQAMYNEIYNNKISDNPTGIEISNSMYNTFWNNSFSNNSKSAYEESTANRNNWNNSLIGNYWDDFWNNTGYPTHYVIDGPGDGVDYKPVGGYIPYQCGDTVYEDAVLAEDLLDCTGNGLIIGADDITLDCNGHLIDGFYKSNDNGIFIDNRTNVTIKNCHITDNDYGIRVFYGSSNTIIGNTVYKNNDGIGLYSSLDNDMIGNTVYDQDNMYGILSIFSSNNSLTDNILYNNKDHGIVLEYSDGNILSGNTANSNKYNGLRLLSSSDNDLISNTFNNNSEGIDMTTSSDNLLDGNIIKNNIGGIRIFSMSNNNIISNNVVAFQDMYGITFDTCDNNMVTKNMINNNSYGVYVMDSFNTFWNNSFTLNNVSAYEETSSSNWNNSLIGNYWSDFESNAGYPTKYVIDGPSDGVDYKPVGGLEEYYFDDPFIVFGEWKKLNYPSAYDGDLIYIKKGIGISQAAWRVDKTVIEGNYSVFIWKFEHQWSGNMATNAHFGVIDANGHHGWFEVDQSTPNDEWVYIGDFYFDDSRIQGVFVNDNADGIVAADAVKLVWK